MEQQTRYGALRGLIGLYYGAGLLVASVGGVGGFFMIAVAAPDNLKWLSVIAGIAMIGMGGLLIAVSQLLLAVADTADYSRRTAEAMEILASTVKARPTK